MSQNKNKNELLVTECSYENIEVNLEVLRDIERIRSEINTLNIDFENSRQLHGYIGLVTEIGELLDAYKKHWFYHKTLDLENVLEECGDLIWYLEVLEECGVVVAGLRHYIKFFIVTISDSTYDKCRANVIKKLRVRYPDGFTNFDAENRDTGAELEAMYR